jgi:DNA-binding protein Fis
MTAVLFIEGDPGLKGTGRDLLAGEGIRAGKKDGSPGSSPLPADARPKQDRDLPLAEVIRKCLRAELITCNDVHVHKRIIGKAERVLIAMILEEEQGNQVQAAKKLGLSRNTLRKKIKDLQITIRVVIQ